MKGIRTARRSTSGPASVDGGLGQLLVCTEGFGFVGTRDGTAIRLRAGESVWTPPGEEHWHGATEGTMMCHHALLEVPDDGTEATTWLEPVTDEQYEQAQPA